MNLRNIEKKYINLYRIIFALIGWITIISRQIVNCVNGECFGMYRFFTIQSNYLVLIWYLFAIYWRNDEERFSRLMGPLKGSITVYITVTFVIFATLLSSSSNPVGFDAYTNLIHHYITPIAFIGDWVISERTKYNWKWLLPMLVFPIWYLIFALILGSITGFFAYFFLNPVELGIGGFSMWVAILVSIFLLFGSLLTLINQKLIIKT